VGIQDFESQRFVPRFSGGRSVPNLALRLLLLVQPLLQLPKILRGDEGLATVHHDLRCFLLVGCDYFLFWYQSCVIGMNAPLTDLILFCHTTAIRQGRRDERRGGCQAGC
jgi:hypothetical protein